MHACLALVLFLAAPASGEPTAQLARLSWMAGAWASQSADEWSEEHWLPARGGTMLGVHRDVRGPRTTAFEFLRIEARPDGLVYLASPGGRPPTEFRAIEVGDERVVFENPRHDFPQRILYWRGKDALHARIEGIDRGQPSSMEWRWARTGR